MRRTLIRKAPDSQEGQKKATCHKNWHLTGRKVQIKSAKQHGFLVWCFAFAGSAALRVTNSYT